MHRKEPQPFPGNGCWEGSGSLDVKGWRISVTVPEKLRALSGHQGRFHYLVVSSGFMSAEHGQWILLFQRSASSKHFSAFIQTVRNKQLESYASSKQLKRLRKLWFAHSIWGEEAKLPHWEQPTFPYNLYNRDVTAAQHCRILLFLLTDQMVLIHRSQTQHFPSPCSQIPESHHSICNLQRN